MDIDLTSIAISEIRNELTKQCEVRLLVLRLDLIHPFISGNKYFKLKYNITEARRQGKDTLLTFGGAYSNHIVATANAGQLHGLKTIGIIRGEKMEPLNSRLIFAKECGMELQFVSREKYKEYRDESFLKIDFPLSENYFQIPEGGANILGIKGCSEIIDFITEPFDTICCACGTGTTLAGIILSLHDNQQVIGFQVLKGTGYLKKEVERSNLLYGIQIVSSPKKKNNQSENIV